MKKKKIYKYIEICGGLGNQMFQYALYKKLEKMGYKTIIDDWKIRKKGNEHNGLDLLNAFKFNYKRSGIFDRIKYEIYRVHDKFIRLLKCKRYYPNILIDQEPTSFSEILKRYNMYLRGYWQEESFFYDIREELLEDFSFRLENIIEENYEIEKEIMSVNSVSIHIRRGDYILEKNMKRRGNICTSFYYESAIKYIKNKEKECKFYFFTDDPQWVKKRFSHLDYKLIDCNIGKKSYCDMYLMSLCKHNIIANSSFSWWGAWLNRNPEKIVICPSKWYNYGESNLILDSWVKISPEGEIVL